MNTYNVYWGPAGKKVATVQAKTAKAAKRKAPMPYRKYLGELYTELVSKNPKSFIPLRGISVKGKTVNFLGNPGTLKKYKKKLTALAKRLIK